MEECHINARTSPNFVSRRSLLVGALACVSALILDQIAKWIVLETLGPGGTRDAIEIIPGALRFHFVRNTGSAFGLFQGNSDILRVLAIVAVVILVIYYLRSASRDWVMALAMGLQVGGALGNIVDRFRHGYVVDFINVPRFPIFNTADSAITVGVVLLMYALLFRDSMPDTSAARRPRVDQPRAAGDDA